MTVTIVYLRSKKDCWGMLKKELKLRLSADNSLKGFPKA